MSKFSKIFDMLREHVRCADMSIATADCARCAVSNPGSTSRTSPRRRASRAHAEPIPVEPDDVADHQLAAAAKVDLTVDRHEPLGDGLLGLSSREDARELQKLPETDRPAAERDIDGLRDRSSTHGT